MKRTSIVIAALAVLLSGCGQQNIKQVLDNLDKDCVRHYAGSIGGTLSTPTVTFQVDCQPSAKAAAAVAPTPAQ